MSRTIINILLLVGSLSLLIKRIECADLPEKEWWETTLVYQIWPRGFQDSDGDGEGDINGIISRLDYIKDLGLETIWINPIYPSPLIDGGFDISNFKEVHPLFGNLQDFDNLIQEAHSRELKVILDIVPNHSSDKHEWFQLSIDNIKPYDNYYIWSDGRLDNSSKNIPPNNWVSVYNNEEGSAWTWNENRKQWYYHKFHESQPDLNLRNKDTREEILSIFDFWLKRGVDGFCINTVPYLFEDKELRDESSVGNGTFTFGLSESTELLYEFRSYIDDWVERNNATTKLLIAESHDIDENLISYYGNNTHKGIAPFNYRFIRPIHNNTDANYIKNVIDGWFEQLPENASTNWVLSNHDFPRVTTRVGLNRVDGLHMLSLLLPGQAYTYYGEEIAMLDAKIPWDKTIDPIACARTKDTYEEFSRDPARTPMQWNSTISAGFSTNETTYLPVHPDYENRNVEKQLKQQYSNIQTYKLLAELRKEPVFLYGDYELAASNNNRVLVLKRSLVNYPLYIIIINLWIGKETVNLTELYPLDSTLKVVVASHNAVVENNVIASDNVILTANAALVLKGEDIVTTTVEPTNVPTNHTDTTESSSSVTNPDSSTVTKATNISSDPSKTTESIITSSDSTKSTIDLSSESSDPSDSEPTEETSNATKNDSSTPTSTVIPSSTEEDDDNSATSSTSTLILVLTTTFSAIALYRF